MDAMKISHPLHSSLALPLHAAHYNELLAIWHYSPITLNIIGKLVLELLTKSRFRPDTFETSTLVFELYFFDSITSFPSTSWRNAWMSSAYLRWGRQLWGCSHQTHMPEHSVISTDRICCRPTGAPWCGHLPPRSPVQSSWCELVLWPPGVGLLTTFSLPLSLRPLSLSSCGLLLLDRGLLPTVTTCPGKYRTIA
jgi:hypothetical protein